MIIRDALVKLITLNMWCGKLFGKLEPFIEKNRSYTDVFCFQEVLDNKPGVKSAVFKDGTEDSFDRIRNILGNDFEGYSALPHPNERGLAMFVNRRWKVVERREEYVYGKKNTMVDNKWSTLGINVLYSRIRRGKEEYSIWTTHGIFVNMEKNDTKETIEQSNNLKSLIDKVSGKKILCGDLNLHPDTESIRILERIPMRNLVRDYGIKSTRTPYYEFPQQYADYIFTSYDINVKNFEAMPDIVSDHLPLSLDC